MLRLRRRRPAYAARLAAYSIRTAAERHRRADWTEITQGNKIVLPRSVYDRLVSRGFSFKQFQILNPEHRELKLFTGPLDFCAAEGECYLPSWVMKQLKLKDDPPAAEASSGKRTLVPPQAGRGRRRALYGRDPPT